MRVVSRRPRPVADTGGYAWAVADLVSGAGLSDALAGAATVVHCAGRQRAGEDVEAVRKLTATARAAGIGHLVDVSIVGVDTIPFPYYAGKLAIERTIADSGLPYTILRATQFHELLRTVLALAARLPVLPAFDLPFQPIAAAVVADRLAELATGTPAGRVEDLAGPEVVRFPELARRYLAFTGRRRPLLPVRLPGAAFAAFRRGDHLAPDRAVPGPTFDDHLAAVPEPRSTRYGGGAR